MFPTNFSTASTDTVRPKAVCSFLAGLLDRATDLLKIAAKDLNQHSQILALRQRHAPDMFSLAQQVIVLSDSLIGAAALLCGATAEQQPAVRLVFNRGDEASLGPVDDDFDAAINRLKRAKQIVLAYETSEPKESFLSECNTIVVERIGQRRFFKATAFVDRYLIPNAYFHLSVIYTLLRTAGVDIGKADFEGPPAYYIDLNPT